MSAYQVRMGMAARALKQAIEFEKKASENPALASYYQKKARKSFLVAVKAEKQASQHK